MTARRTTAVTAVAATILAAAVATTGTAASAAPSGTAIPNTAPTWIAHARHLGHANSSGAVNAIVYLAPQGGVAALKAAALAVSTPGSAAYHKFLSHAQYAQRFGTRASTVAAVSKYLRAVGLKVTGIGQGNRYLSIAGTVAKANKAFGTSIERYQHGSHLVQAPARTLRVPAALGSAVLSVSGLDTTRHLAVPQSKAAHAPAGFRNAKPCSAYYGQKTATSLPAFEGKTLPYAVCGYTGTQLRNAYEQGSNLDGSGVTVAITDAYASPTIRGDANNYAVRHGGQPFAAGQFVQTKPASYNEQADCQPSGWYGEETLDVEAVHAMAPGAKIHYYGAANCDFDNGPADDGFLPVLQQIVDEDTAQIVTNSWGDTEASYDAAMFAPYDAVFMQGAVEGISFLFSSGDDGDEVAAYGSAQAGWPASSPWATSVGGTSTAIGADSTLAFSTGWGTKKWSPAEGAWKPQGFLYGGGGGLSHRYAKPSYQDGVVSGDYRNTPDMAMDADPTTGMLVGETQIFPDGTYYDEYRIGGTSLASPLFAGMTALAVQHAGHGGGLLNPAIYGQRKAFSDVRGNAPDRGNVRSDYANGVDASDGVVYSVRSFNQDSSLRVRPGWDDVTGVGVPNPGWLTALG
jgi:subtilase family serine protease